MASDMTVHREWKPVFIEALAEIPNIQAAAKVAGIARPYAYEARGKDPEFAAAWDAAIECGVDNMEIEAHRRGVKGTDKPVFQGKELVGHIREYSDTLLIFLLKAHRPDKYRDNMAVRHTGAVGHVVVTPKQIIEDLVPYADAIRELFGHSGISSNGIAKPLDGPQAESNGQGRVEAE